MTILKIQLSQINPTVGDLDGNAGKILREVKLASESGCDLVVFSEMVICGYPCEDLWLRKDFISACQHQISKICDLTKDLKCAILLGAPTFDLEKKKEVVRNSAILLERGEIKRIIHKKTLPNSGVFDERRYFEPASALSCVEFRGITLAILICEDLWDQRNLFLLSEQIFDFAIALNASPYSSKKHDYRHSAAKNLGKSLLYVNQVGGQDSLVFDGSSFVMNDRGEIILQMKDFTEDSAIIEVTKSGTVTPLPTADKWRSEASNLQSAQIKNQEASGYYRLPTRNNRDYRACVLALHDYIRKNDFEKVILGMSGGIDSALVAAMAVDALGKCNVTLYALPSRYSSDESMYDAVECAKNLGVKLEVISIEPMFEAALFTLRQARRDPQSITQENLQSRIRGNILMALSNDTGALLLSTGNKSELATGYTTIYGDMCGAFNPLKDLYKTQIYDLARLKSDVISQNILTKAPTAELRPNQKDSDSLPDYEILDCILFALIEERKSVAEIAKNFDENLVRRVARLLKINEYKRRQSCPGSKISDMAFDKDWRYPITNKSFI
ncbi:MAG: NAD+ synthase [Alphaproteobacteria bacterium]|nr:NAD+ synthase [Alphaproteobacteria bacterium]